MKQLIICERPYMVYKAILKAMNSEDVIDIVLSNHMIGLEKLFTPLVESKIFNKVFFLPDDLYQDYIKDENLADYVKFPAILWSWPKKLIRYFKYQSKARKKSLPEDLKFNSYDEVLVNDGVSTLNFKLNFERHPYVVSEHGRGNFRNKLPLHILAVHISIILDRLNIIVAYSGCSKYVKAVEVDKNEDLVGYIKRKKIRECSISELEKNLSVEQKNVIYKIYARTYDLPMEYDEEVNLLLTGPLAQDKNVTTEEDQINCYKDIVAKYGTGKRLMVKPHPRDIVDYTKVFPDAIVVHKLVSSEVLSFCDTLKIEKVMTVMSSSVGAFGNANDVIVLGPEFLDNYHPYIRLKSSNTPSQSQ